MPELLLHDLLLWTGAELLHMPEDPACLPKSLQGVCSDSRAVRPGSLFVALIGEHFDGHDYLGQAIQQGAGGLLISSRQAWSELVQNAQTRNRLISPVLPAVARTSDEPVSPVSSGSPGSSGLPGWSGSPGSAGLPVLLVPDTLAAMQAIAAGYRASLSAPVIAITGSVGKTTTRQMVSACLQSSLQVHQTAGNLNNEIGLPQTLLQAEPEDQAIILEMGMRGPGEIALLSQIARPDIGVITGIGWSHIGRLGSQSAILSAKAEILTGMKPDQLLILNGDDPLLLGLGRSLAGRQRLAYVSAGDDPVADALLMSAGGEFVLRAGSIQATATDISFVAVSHVPGQAHQAIPVHLPFPGRHHVRNALFGLAVAHALGIALERAATGAAACQNSGNRQHLIKVGAITLMDDTYNAAPESMQAALETLAGLAGTERRKLAAIGCMLELGDYAPEAHRQVGELVARLGYQLLLVIGPQAEDLLDGARSVRPDLPSCVCTDLDDMTRRLLATLQPGDHLLVKGSRAFAMEQVSSEIVRVTGRSGITCENHEREED